jgi:hypothetical protein
VWYINVDKDIKEFPKVIINRGSLIDVAYSKLAPAFIHTADIFTKLI